MVADREDPLTGAALSRVRASRLLAGGACVIGGYVFAVASGGVRDLGQVDAVIGLGGYVLVPPLIWRGGSWS